MNTPIERAREIAVQVYGSETDECGYPVMRRLDSDASRNDDEDVICAAYLQRVLQRLGKTYMTFLAEERFSMRTVYAAEMLYFREGEESFGEYIDRILTHDIASAVMISDLEYRSDAGNYIDPDEEMLGKINMYKEAYLKVKKNAPKLGY